MNARKIDDDNYAITMQQGQLHTLVDALNMLDKLSTCGIFNLPEDQDRVLNELRDEVNGL